MVAIADNNNRNNEHSMRREFKPLVPLSKQTATLDVKKMYDDKWADKQIESFTEWINFTFSQSGAQTDDVDSNSVGAGLRLLMQRRLEAQVRQRAMLIFHGSDVSVPLFALGEEICEGRLIIRDDKNVHADLGLQKTLLDLLFSYELPWLRLGLEVVFGQILSLKQSGPDVPCKTGDAKWKKMLKAFILERLFADPEIQSRYNKDKLLYPKHQEAMKHELRAHLVKKFLAVVLVMDIAREQRLLSLPTLFVSNASTEIKSSKEVLLSFCKEFLKGEGDFVRHLGLMGYSVSFLQTYTDEFDYAVSNLAVDLRDGVRLAHLVELLAKSNDLSSQLRVPAVSLTQKTHNVKLALDKVYNSTGEAAPEVRKIVEGDRDSTLLFLWKLMFSFELKMLIDPSRVRKEAAAIRQNQAWRRSVYDAAEAGHFAVTVPTAHADGSVTFPAPLPAAEPSLSHQGGVKGQDDSDLACALLEWCDAVAGQYGVAVYNLTSCLADGRALCLLVHYYHPSLLPTKVIKKTTQNIAAAFSSNTALDSFTEASIEVPKQEARKALEGETKNFATLKRACSDIGGIPSMLPACNSNNQPESKTMTIFLGYLFARLIESSEQVRAAIRIQRVYRRAIPALRRSLCAKRVKKAPSKAVRAAPATREAKHVLTDVSVTVVMSHHQAANIIKRLIITHCTRRAYLRALQARAEEAWRAQEAAAYQAQLAAMQREAEEREEWEEALRLQREQEELAACEAAKVVARERALELERRLSEEAEAERVRLMEMHEETAKLAIEAAESLRAEKEAADEECQRALQEAEDARAEAEAEAERVADLEEKIRQYEEAQEIAEEEAEALDETRRRLEEQVAAGNMTQAALIAQLEQEQAAKVAAEAEARTKYEELAALNAQLAEEKLAAARAAAAEREAEATRVANERMEKVVQAERDAREAAEKQAAEEAEKRQELEERIRQLEAARVEDQAAAQESERARAENEARLAAELAAKVEAARVKAEEQVRRQKEEEAAAAAVLVNTEREAREALEAKIRAEAAARKAAEAQLQAIEEARLREEETRQREAEEARLAAIVRGSAGTLLQTAWRRSHATSRFRRFRLAVIKLQAAARSIAVRHYMYKLSVYASFVQSMWRTKRMARVWTKLSAAALKVQTSWRAVSARRKYMAHLLSVSTQLAESTMNAEAARIRREHKEAQAASSLTRWARGKVMFARLHRLVCGFRRIGAVFRSHKVRRSSSPDVQNMLHRLAAADQRARADPSLCLGAQTKVSLEVLQSGKMISSLLKACQMLDLSTQVSRRCCDAFTQAQASSVLFGLIRSCNRSTPHQEILRFVLPSLSLSLSLFPFHFPANLTLIPPFRILFFTPTPAADTPWLCCSTWPGMTNSPPSSRRAPTRRTCWWT